MAESVDYSSKFPAFAEYEEGSEDEPVEYISKDTPQVRRWIDLPAEFKPKEVIQMANGTFAVNSYPSPFGGGGTPAPFNVPGTTSQVGVGGLVAGAGRLLGGGAVGTIGRWLGIGGAAAAGGAAVEVLLDADGNVVDTRLKKRRRRRRMLTCSDKADIAFLRGTLGGGELGKAAITSMLTSRCGR